METISTTEAPTRDGENASLLSRFCKRHGKMACHGCFIPMRDLAPQSETKTPNAFGGQVFCILCKGPCTAFSTCEGKNVQTHQANRIDHVDINLLTNIVTFTGPCNKETVIAWCGTVHVTQLCKQHTWENEQPLSETDTKPHCYKSQCNPNTPWRNLLHFSKATYWKHLHWKQRFKVESAFSNVSFPGLTEAQTFDA